MLHGKLIGLIVLGAATTIGIIGLVESHSHAPQPDRTSGSTYADPSTCATCHQTIAARYSQTGMARTFSSPRLDFLSQDLLKGATLFHPPSDRYYTTSAQGEGLYQRRYQIGFGGGKTNEVQYRIDYVIGSGNHARTFLHRDHEGRLIELPVSWYRENGGYWGMSPGYDEAHQEDFRRPVNYDCIFCHNAYADSGGDRYSRSDAPVFPEQLPTGIDCQRCHGPGRAHIETVSSGRATPEEIRRSVLNPRRLDRERQLDVCMQCHLETSTLPFPHAIRRFERPPFSYRAGEDLTDYAAYFTPAPGAGFDDRFEVAHQAFRLRKSACFLQSQMTCTTCHDPHEELSGERATEHFTAICQSCHASAHENGQPLSAAKTTCLDCHMWKRRTDDAVHVVMTDHYIQRNKPRRDFLAPFPESHPIYRGDAIPYSLGKGVPDSRDELYSALAQVQIDSNLQTGTPRLQRAIDRAKPNQPEFYFGVGMANLKAGRSAEAIRSFDQALRLRADYQPALANLAMALALTGDLARAAQIGERAAGARLPDAGAMTNLGNIYLRQGKLDQARQTLEKALGVNPDLPDANNLLGQTEARLGDMSRAESSFRTAIALQPDFSEARTHLANILSEKGQYPEAADQFKKAISANPTDADAHHGYGIMLALSRSFGPAVLELESAIKISPDDGQIHSDLADVLLEKGDADRAGAEYRRSIQLRPQLAEPYYGLGSALLRQKKPDDAAAQFQNAIRINPDYDAAHLALATILAYRGKTEEARGHLQKAASSSDPAVRQAALNALR